MHEIAYFGADLRRACCAAVVPFETTFFLEVEEETAGRVISNGTREIHRMTVPGDRDNLIGRVEGGSS